MTIKRLVLAVLLAGVVAAPLGADSITPISLGSTAIQSGAVPSIPFGGAGPSLLDWTLSNQTGRPWSGMRIVVQFSDPLFGWRDATPNDGFGLPFTGQAVVAVRPGPSGVITETFSGDDVITDTLGVEVLLDSNLSPSRSMTASQRLDLVQWDYKLNGWTFDNGGASLNFLIPVYIPTGSITITQPAFAAPASITGTLPTPWRLQATPTYPTPEPATMLLFGAGGAALWLARRRKSD